MIIDIYRARNKKEKHGRSSQGLKGTSINSKDLDSMILTEQIWHTISLTTLPQR
jgi:hypothetical protein